MANYTHLNTILHKKNLLSLLCITINTLALFCFHQNAIAGTRYSNVNNNNIDQTPVDFSLSFSRTDMDAESNNIIYPIVQNRISAILVNKISTSLKIGLIIGSNHTTLDNDAPTAGLSLNGNHFGFSVNEIFGKHLQIGLHAYYIYQQATGENALRTASLTWHEWLAEATLRVSLGNNWAIIAGGGITGLDVDRRVSGDINETIRMELANDAQGRLAVEVFTEHR